MRRIHPTDEEKQLAVAEDSVHVEFQAGEGCGVVDLAEVHLKEENLREVCAPRYSWIQPGSQSRTQEQYDRYTRRLSLPVSIQTVSLSP